MTNLVNHINTYQSEADYQNDKSKNFPNVSYIVENDNVLFVNEKTYYSNVYLTFEVVNGGNITITASIANVAKTIQYSTDNGSTWTSLTTSTTAQELGGTLSVGDKVLVKGTNTTYGTDSFYNTFGGTAKVNVYGNIMSLTNGDSFANATTFEREYVFAYLFENANIINAKNLVLPATTLASSCYRGMFRGCTSLVNAPSVLPATTLADNCYGSMFSGCTSLTTAPELPATTLARNSYNTMFRGCTSLVTAPDLPATTLESWCYTNMFNGCSNLNYIKCLATNISASSCLMDWVNGVASTGTFVKAANMTSWRTGVNGIPDGWTVVTE